MNSQIPVDLYVDDGENFMISLLFSKILDKFDGITCTRTRTYIYKKLSYNFFFFIKIGLTET